MMQSPEQGIEAGQSVPDVSILIVSYNTARVLRECLESILAGQGSLRIETIVIDNGSRDDSVAMMRSEFPWVRVIESKINLGFGGANNRAYEDAHGRYIVLLNSDAFLRAETLEISVRRMDADAEAGLASGRLVGRDGELQPSARMFPTLTTQFLVMSGLADKYPKSTFFGQTDRTWADPLQDAEVDWVPGAYSIIRNSILQKIGFFDPIFFLYYEEVDLCRRIQQAGFRIMYWPEIVVTHIGGESSRQVKSLEMSTSGAQLILWRMRSTLLFHRKHSGAKVSAVRWLETIWYRLRAARNRMRSGPEAEAQVANQMRLATLMDRAWQETRGGRVSPPQPW